MTVRKRDGRIVEFDPTKIEAAILKAFAAVDGEISDYAKDKAKNIANYIQSYYEMNEEKTPTIEDIQDLCEKGLMSTKRKDVARAYVTYRNDRSKARRANESLVNYKKIIDDYLKVDDWRVKENSTVTYSVGGLILSNSGAITANYWLSEVYDEEIGNAHRNADIHIHDLSMLTGYCAGWSLKQLIQEGLGGVTGKITSAPASHLSTLCNQMVNFLGIMQNEWAGAQAFSSFDTYLAPFVKVDNLSYKEVKQCIQSFIYGVNTPSRWGTQAPFTNITLDWTVPADLAELNCIVGGKEMDFRYKDCKKEMDMVNKAFIEIMIEGDANGRGFQYPIPTYSITRDFDWSETENNRLLFEMTAKYGTPYFSNYINSDMEPSDVRSMCPLTGDTKLLIRSSKGISIQPIEQLAHNQLARDTVYEVWTPEGWKKAKLNKQEMTKIFAITLRNGETICMGENHLQPVLNKGTKMAKDLQIGDWLPFNKNPLIQEKNLGSYELGFAVGAYAGDGSHDGNAILYSLDMAEKDDETEAQLTAFWESIGYPVVVSRQKNVRMVRVNGSPYDIISLYIEGDNALTKTFTNRVYNNSADFRKGVIAGFRMTDGCREKPRLYTSSVTLKEDLITLFATLGQKALCHYEDNRENRLGKNTNYRVDYPSRTNYGDYYKEDNQFNYFRIDKIEEISTKDKNLYCLEVDNDSHLFMLANGLITHNCRLRLDLRELRKKSGGFFGSGESTGSVGVVTINMPRIAYLSASKQEFYERLDKMMDIAARSLKVKRNVITQLLENGLYPYTKRYLGTFANHFSTIGLVGMNEACLNANWLRKDLTNKEAQDFTIEVLNHMRERLSDYQEQYGDLYNLEATPAESTSFRLAKHDKEKYPDIITAAKTCDQTPYYTNSSHLPVGYTEDIFSALDIQDQLQTLYTSGTVFHAFLGEKLPDWKAAANLVRKIAENYKLPYYTMSPTYSVCKTHGYLAGEQSVCPICGNPTEVYSRITGYYRPVQNWNDGKLQEFKDRKTYKFDVFETPIVKETKVEEPVDECGSCSVEAPNTDGYLLIATTTCPNCKIISALMTKHDIPFTKIYADEQPELCKQLGVSKAPTLLYNGEKYSGVSDIKKFLKI